MIFTIDADNAITANDAAPATQDGVLAFASEKEFAAATAECPIIRLVEVWNGFAGAAPFNELKPVKKFENRPKATTRIWTAIQKLAPVPEEPTTPFNDPPADPKATKAPTKSRAPNAPKKVRKAKLAIGKPTAREGTAKAKVIGMLQRKGGATLDAITEATGWQKHSIRGFISILRSKHGMKIESSKRESDGARVYTAR